MKFKHISNFGSMGGVQTYLCGIQNYSNNLMKLASLRNPLDFYKAKIKGNESIEKIKIFDFPYAKFEEILILHNIILAKFWPVLYQSQRLIKKPVIYHEHGIAWHNPDRNYHKYLERISKVDSIIVNSYATYLLLRKKYSVQNKIHIIKYPLYFSESYLKDNKNSIINFSNELNKNKIIRIGFMGRLEAHKNPIFLMKVARNLKAKYGYDVKLDYLGIGSQEKFLKKKALEMKLSVNFAGLVDQKRKFVDKWDFAIYPSLREPFGLVQGEIALMNKLCLSSNVDGMPEAYPPSSEDLLIEMVEKKTNQNLQNNYQYIHKLNKFSKNYYPDVEDCTLKILKLIKNPSLYKKLLKNQKDFLIKNFCIEKHFKEILEVLKIYE